MSADKRTWPKDMPTYYGHQDGHGKPDGRGVVLHPDGGFEGGDYRNGMPNGWFVTMDPGGSVYAGDVVNGRKHGRGITISPGNGVVILGVWTDGELTGEAEAFVLDVRQSPER